MMSIWSERTPVEMNQMLRSRLHYGCGRPCRPGLGGGDRRRFPIAIS